jgi:DAK2 domain fusion protein YloV
MKLIAQCSGRDLKEMFAAGTAWLEKNAAAIDALNVFPVPDGDTGTNMLLTMQSSTEDAYGAADESASVVAQAMAHGALLGARGNSGVILSQILRGLARGLEGKDSFAGSDLADALQEASAAAYRALSHPVEGTILTVIHDAADAASTTDSDNLISIMEATVNAARDSVAKTPTLLPVLREAGVVDAGGQGLYTLLEGILYYLKSGEEEMQYRRPGIIASGLSRAARVLPLAVEEEVYGYCSEFLLEGERLNPEGIKKKLEGKGKSLIVVGDDYNVRVHIHTLDPGGLIRYATTRGTLHQISIRNMDEQHKKFSEMQKAAVLLADIATVAVVSGDGLSDVFRSLGTTVIVPGGQTMNPSPKQFLQAIEGVKSEKVILLPNNPNIILAARQSQSLTQKRVVVVPTETIPQGVAALLAFNYDADLEANAAAMEGARTAVKTVEVTRAVRATNMGGLRVKKGQAIGLVEGELVAAGDSRQDMVNKLLLEGALVEAEVVTLYYGGNTPSAEAEEIAEGIRQRYPGVDVEVVKGGQPHYDYIISIE